MTVIKFVVTESMNELTWEDWNALEEGASKHTREIMARFLVDENDRPVEYNKAMKILGSCENEGTGRGYRRILEVFAGCERKPSDRQQIIAAMKSQQQEWRAFLDGMQL